MNIESLKELLNDFKDGRLSEDDVLEKLRTLPFEDLGFALGTFDYRYDFLFCHRDLPCTRDVMRGGAAAATPPPLVTSLSNRKQRLDAREA